MTQVRTVVGVQVGRVRGHVVILWYLQALLRILEREVCWGQM